MNMITNKFFGKFRNKEVILTSLTEQDTSISIMNWGAAIQNWKVNQSQNSVILGFEDFELYPQYSPYFGSIVGRVINRIN